MAQTTVFGVWKQGREIDRQAYRRHLQQQAVDEKLWQEMAMMAQSSRQ